MTTARQIAANRRNAGCSTGPRSIAGRNRSARNAMQHGLSRSALQNPVLAPEVARLAAAITGGRDELLELAIQIAEAEVVLLRARQMRGELINRALKDPHFALHANPVRFLSFAAQMVRAAETGRFGTRVEREAAAWSERSSEPALERQRLRANAEPVVDVPAF